MPFTTEIVVMPLRPGSEIGNPENEAAKVLKKASDTLYAQDGVQDVYFGMQVENENTLQMLINWDSLEHHKRFMALDIYQPFLEEVGSVAAGEPTIVHSDLKPADEFSKAVSAPVTEVATLYFDGEMPASYLDGMQSFADAIVKGKIEGYLGSTIGITHEEIEQEGAKGKAAVIVIGWSSIDAHMAFRETQVFKDNVHLLKTNSSREMHHVQFLKAVK